MSSVVPIVGGPAVASIVPINVVEAIPISSVFTQPVVETPSYQQIIYPSKNLNIRPESYWNAYGGIQPFYTYTPAFLLNTVQELGNRLFQANEQLNQATQELVRANQLSRIGESLHLLNQGYQPRQVINNYVNALNTVKTLTPQFINARNQLLQSLSWISEENALKYGVNLGNVEKLANLGNAVTNTAMQLVKTNPELFSQSLTNARAINIGELGKLNLAQSTQQILNSLNSALRNGNYQLVSRLYNQLATNLASLSGIFVEGSLRNVVNPLYTLNVINAYHEITGNLPPVNITPVVRQLVQDYNTLYNVYNSMASFVNGITGQTFASTLQGRGPNVGSFVLPTSNQQAGNTINMPTTLSLLGQNNQYNINNSLATNIQNLQPAFILSNLSNQLAQLKNMINQLNSTDPQNIQAVTSLSNNIANAVRDITNQFNSLLQNNTVANSLANYVMQTYNQLNSYYNSLNNLYNNVQQNINIISSSLNNVENPIITNQGLLSPQQVTSQLNMLSNNIANIKTTLSNLKNIINSFNNAIDQFKANPNITTLSQIMNYYSQINNILGTISQLGQQLNNINTQISYLGKQVGLDLNVTNITNLRSSMPAYLGNLFSNAITTGINDIENAVGNAMNSIARMFGFNANNQVTKVLLTLGPLYGIDKSLLSLIPDPNRLNNLLIELNSTVSNGIGRLTNDINNIMKQFGYDFGYVLGLIGTSPTFLADAFYGWGEIYSNINSYIKNHWNEFASTILDPAVNTILNSDVFLDPKLRPYDKFITTRIDNILSDPSTAQAFANLVAYSIPVIGPLGHLASNINEPMENKLFDLFMAGLDLASLGVGINSFASAFSSALNEGMDIGDAFLVGLRQSFNDVTNMLMNVGKQAGIGAGLNLAFDQIANWISGNGLLTKEQALNALESGAMFGAIAYPVAEALSLGLNSLLTKVPDYLSDLMPNTNIRDFAEKVVNVLTHDPIASRIYMSNLAGLTNMALTLPFTRNPNALLHSYLTGFALALAMQTVLPPAVKAINDLLGRNVQVGNVYFTKPENGDIIDAMDTKAPGTYSFMDYIKMRLYYDAFGSVPSSDEINNIYVVPLSDLGKYGVDLSRLGISPDSSLNDPSVEANLGIITREVADYIKTNYGVENPTVFILDNDSYSRLVRFYQLLTDTLSRFNRATEPIINDPNNGPLLALGTDTVAWLNTQRDLLQLMLGSNISPEDLTSENVAELSKYGLQNLVDMYHVTAQELGDTFTAMAGSTRAYDLKNMYFAPGIRLDFAYIDPNGEPVIKDGFADVAYYYYSSLGQRSIKVGTPVGNAMFYSTELPVLSATTNEFASPTTIMSDWVKMLNDMLTRGYETGLLPVSMVSAENTGTFANLRASGGIDAIKSAWQEWQLVVPAKGDSLYFVEEDNRIVPLFDPRGNASFDWIAYATDSDGTIKAVYIPGAGGYVLPQGADNVDTALDMIDNAIRNGTLNKEGSVQLITASPEENLMGGYDFRSYSQFITQLNSNYEDYGFKIDPASYINGELNNFHIVDLATGQELEKYEYPGLTGTSQINKKGYVQIAPPENYERAFENFYEETPDIFKPFVGDLTRVLRTLLSSYYPTGVGTIEFNGITGEARLPPEIENIENENNIGIETGQNQQNIPEANPLGVQEAVIGGASVGHNLNNNQQLTYQGLGNIQPVGNIQSLLNQPLPNMQGNTLNTNTLNINGQILNTNAGMQQGNMQRVLPTFSQLTGNAVNAYMLNRQITLTQTNQVGNAQNIQQTGSNQTASNIMQNNTQNITQALQRIASSINQGQSVQTRNQPAIQGIRQGVNVQQGQNIQYQIGRPLQSQVQQMAQQPLQPLEQMQNVRQILPQQPLQLTQQLVQQIQREIAGRQTQQPLQQGQQITAQQMTQQRENVQIQQRNIPIGQQVQSPLRQQITTQQMTQQQGQQVTGQQQTTQQRGTQAQQIAGQILQQQNQQTNETNQPFIYYYLYSMPWIGIKNTGQNLPSSMEKEVIMF